MATSSTAKAKSAMCVLPSHKELGHPDGVPGSQKPACPESQMDMT
jgi:hypothetical protein